MVESRKELRFYITSSILVGLVVSMTFTTFLSSAFPSGFGLGASNSFIRLASATSSEGGGGSGGGDDDGGDDAGGDDAGGGDDQGGASDTEPEPIEDTEEVPERGY